MAAPLLEPVSAGQTRFRMQGLAPDARGIAVGRETLVVLPSLDRLVAFLGAYSDEASLDDLVPTMTLERVSRDGGGHALLMRCAARDGYAADRLARLAAATSGQAYTGSGSLFIRGRERDAPFGHDLLRQPSIGTDEVVAVDVDYLARYRTLDRLDPVDLIQRLQLRPVPLPLGGIAGDPELSGLREMALVLVAPGLADRVLDYLWRAGANMAGFRVHLDDDRQPSLLLRLRTPKARTLEVLHRTPGAELLVPVSSRAAVQLGYRHPLHLASASSCFPGEEMFLFRGTARRVERLAGPPRFVDGRHLVRSEGVAAVAAVESVEVAELAPLRLELSLRPTVSPREPRGALIPWEQADLLRRLVYLLPPSALAESQVAVVPSGIVVITGSSVGSRGSLAGLGAASVVPLGRRLCEVAPGVLVPDGFELWPRVRPQLTRDLLGLEPEDHAVYLAADSPPLRLPPEGLVALDAAFLGRLSLEAADVVEPDLEAVEPGRLHNVTPGRFALWGFGSTGSRSAGSAPALPAESAAALEAATEVDPDGDAKRG